MAVNLMGSSVIEGQRAVDEFEPSLDIRCYEYRILRSFSDREPDWDLSFERVLPALDAAWYRVFGQNFADGRHGESAHADLFVCIAVGAPGLLDWVAVLCGAGDAQRFARAGDGHTLYGRGSREGGGRTRGEWEAAHVNPDRSGEIGGGVRCDPFNTQYFWEVVKPGSGVNIYFSFCHVKILQRGGVRLFDRVRKLGRDGVHDFPEESRHGSCGRRIFDVVNGGEV